MSVFTAYEIDEIGTKGQLQDALSMALDAIRGGAQDDDLFFIAASLAFQLGELDKAAQLISALLTRDPDHANGWLMFGKIFQARGDMIRAGHGRLMAENVFPAMKVVEPDAHELAAIPEREERIRETEQSAEEISFDTVTFAEICTRQGYFNKALKIYYDLLKKNPHDAELKRRIEDLNKRLNND